MPGLLHDLLRDAAARTPDREALVTLDGRWTYAAVADRAAAVAAQLVGAGIGRGARVGVVAANGLDWVAACFGALGAGAVAVLINAATDPRSLAEQLDDCDARALIVGPRVERLVVQAGAALGARLVLAPASAVTALATAAPAATVMATATAPAPWPTVDLTPDDRALIIYTSGSTGKPRGVVLRHAAVRANVASIVSYLELGDDERTLALLPFHYVYGLSILTTTFAVGGAVVVETRFQYPTTALDTMARERVTGISGVPSTYAILMHRTDFATRLAGGLPDLRWLTQAGGGMSPALTRALADAVGPRRLFVMYGATEASARLAYLPPGELRDAIGSIGRAIPGVTLTVRRPDGTPCAVDEVGELYAEGANLMEGYWNAPDDTARVLGPHGYRTGDLARADAAGRLWLVGRTRDLLKVGGHRVSAKEIEDAIAEHPGVHECAVIGEPDELLGDRLRAFVVPCQPGAVDAASLGAFLRGRVAAYKVPGDIELRADLPRNASGKIMKDALRGSPAVSSP